MSRPATARGRRRAALGVRWVLGLLAAGTLAGCMPALRPAPPQAAVQAPPQWREQGEATTAGIDAQWWRGFGDARLAALVEAALARNTDVLAAAARVDEARAAWRTADAADMPVLNGALGVSAQRALGSFGMANTRVARPELQASWEADLWGRLGRLTEAADLRYRASRAERDGVALSVAAATAQSYIGLLSLHAQLRLTQATAASRGQALRLAEDQLRVGYISRLQLTQARAEYEAVLQAVPQIERAIRQQENALRVLAGEQAGEAGQLMEERAAGADGAAADSSTDASAVLAASGRFDALAMLAVPATLPSELLARRPDIVRGELLLAATDATLDARRAAFLPQVTISASVGRLFVNALDYSPETVWSLGGSILAPIFSAGRLEAQVDAAAAQRDQAAYAYRGAVLSAFAEVENALTGVVRLREQVEHGQRRRTVLAQSLGFAHDRYQAGYVSYLEELDAQRNLYQLEIDLIRLRQSQFDNLIGLYRALGGGWSAAGLSAVRDPAAGAAR